MSDKPSDESESSDEVTVFHVMPEDDSVEHYESPSCICEPDLDYKDPRNGNEVWVHRSIKDSRQ
jgi:hypothetical protein